MMENYNSMTNSTKVPKETTPRTSYTKRITDANITKPTNTQKKAEQPNAITSKDCIKKSSATLDQQKWP